jgi:NhaP-type Na+/H+ or K+/H+ antiporter
MVTALLITVFRRLPAIMLSYKFMSRCVSDWKEALFMGYFGPIGIGAVQYVEHTRLLVRDLEEHPETDSEAGRKLVQKMVPVVYWLVLFSIFWHGLTTPILSFIYRRLGVKPIKEDSSADSIAEDTEASDECVEESQSGRDEEGQRRSVDNSRMSTHTSRISVVNNPRISMARASCQRTPSAQPMIRESHELV